MNAYLCEEDFRVETLQLEGTALFAVFGDVCCGGSVDVSAAYHSVHMRPDAITNFGFDWQD